MARAIDGTWDSFLLNLSYLTLKDFQENKAGLNTLKTAVESQPTITPPNEPLTLEQLREMDGQPVFLVFMQPIEYGWEDQWALVDSENETVFNGAYKFDFSNCVGFAYRRPPEGEA